MCGLIYCRSLDNIPAGKRVIKRYNQQKSRGQNGFGFVGFSSPVETYQRFSSEERLIETLKKDKSKEILFHHRKPTSTPNLPEQAHPIMIKTPKIKKN